MTTFGDHEPDDTFDTAEADPEQVAKKLHNLEGGRWSALSEEEQRNRVELMVRLIAWLRRSGHFR